MPITDDDEQAFIQHIEYGMFLVAKNYEREGSGPGSRFANETLEHAQARYVWRVVREFNDPRRIPLPY